MPNISTDIGKIHSWILRTVTVVVELLSCVYSLQPHPPPMEFSRQEYWSRLPFPSPGNLPSTGIEPMSLESPKLQKDSLPLSHPGSPITMTIGII